MITEIEAGSRSGTFRTDRQSRHEPQGGSLAWGLVNEARRRTGLQDLGDPDIESRLSLLVDSIEAEASLHFRGKFLARMHFKELLETRLQLVNRWRTLSLEDQSINRPVFITGMPRSGSTFLHELFVQDPANRGPLVWETMHPPQSVPVDAREMERRIKQCARSLWWFRQIAPRADAVHPMRALSPHECVAIQSYTFLSQEFVTTFRVPTYEEYLNRADLPAYVWEKRFLQYLQWGTPVRRWVLKAPDHVFGIDALLEVFPDAVIIQMHRNPLEVIRSSKRLIEVIRGVFAPVEEGERTLEQEARALSNGMARITLFRDCHPELATRFIDVHYSQLIGDPLGTLRRLYAKLEWPWTSAVADRTQALASRSVRYPSSSTSPPVKPAVTESAVNSTWFADYCARFGIQSY